MQAREKINSIARRKINNRTNYEITEMVDLAHREQTLEQLLYICSVMFKKVEENMSMMREMEAILKDKWNFQR